ncbi:MAG: class I SAM-dependent methyltransferase [Pyrinomonadaceae bacterium]
MLLRPLEILEQITPYPAGNLSPRRRFTVADSIGELLHGLQRRWQRERRRRKVGRAYDMALEVARVVPRHSRVLDVGCGNGFIAHHLSAMLGTKVTGIDLDEDAQTPIDYLRFDGTHFPVEDQSFDGVLFCYVLHHAQDLGAILGEVRRVLRPTGRLVVYEDIPEVWWDRFVCWTHNLQWQSRTGPCTFRREDEWRDTFGGAGFEIVNERRLSRMRNLAHPVRRRFYFLKLMVS